MGRAPRANSNLAQYSSWSFNWKRRRKALAAQQEEVLVEELTVEHESIEEIEDTLPTIPNSGSEGPQTHTDLSFTTPIHNSITFTRPFKSPTRARVQKLSERLKYIPGHSPSKKKSKSAADPIPQSLDVFSTSRKAVKHVRQPTDCLSPQNLSPCQLPEDLQVPSDDASNITSPILIDDSPSVPINPLPEIIDVVDQLSVHEADPEEWFDDGETSDDEDHTPISEIVDPQPDLFTPDHNDDDEEGAVFVAQAKKEFVFPPSVNEVQLAQADVAALLRVKRKGGYKRNKGGFINGLDKKTEERGQAIEMFLWGYLDLEKRDPDKRGNWTEASRQVAVFCGKSNAWM
ncbi:hypothetical protein WG66_014322 [Moniliophthora roreri]|nr:hypothetical protein WG66_014322 [Moniliophthora roreri]